MDPEPLDPDTLDPDTLDPEPLDPESPPGLRRVRRRDRAVDDPGWIAAFLSRAPAGVLALGGAEAAPHLNSNLFAYDPDAHALLLHTARHGGLRDAVEADPAGAAASFHAFVMGRLLPDARALEFSVEYAGVTAVGRLRRVRDPAAARAALQRIMDKYAPHLAPDRDYEPATAADLRRTSVFRLDIESWSGKRKRAPDDHPGAYPYPHRIDLDTPVPPGPDAPDRV